jgi:L-lactate dehydrogenase complex protein LldG
MNKDLTARETILNHVRAAVNARSGDPLKPPPLSARFEPRKAASLDEEATRMLGEVKKLGGHGLRVCGREDFSVALGDLIRAEGIRTAAFSAHPFYAPYDVDDLLRAFGVEILSHNGDGRRLVECDMGMTVADAALPETGTVLLRTTQGQPDALSLLPRVHLALVAPEALLADLHHAFALAKGDRHFVLVSGCSRTADIEKVLTLGVHGPKSFHLWICGDPRPPFMPPA